MLAFIKMYICFIGSLGCLVKDMDLLEPELVQVSVKSTPEEKLRMSLMIVKSILCHISQEMTMLYSRYVPCVRGESAAVCPAKGISGADWAVSGV